MEELRVIAGSTRLPSVTARDLLAVIFRQRRLQAITFLVIALGCLGYRLTAPAFRAEMSVLISRSRVDPAVTATPTQVEFEHEGVTEEDLNSEVELLRDQEILRTVTQAAGLFPEKGFSIWKLLGESDDERLARAVRRLSRDLDVEAVKKTTLIDVSYDSADPAKAALVLKCLAGAYLERHARLNRPSGESNFFEQQIVESRSNLQTVELQLMDFTRTEGVVSAAQQRDIALQRLGEAEANERTNQVEISATAQRVRMLLAKLPSMPERATTLIRNSDNPQLMAKIKARLLELQLKRTELLTKFDPSYRLVQEVDQEIAETKGSIAQEEISPLRDQSTDLDPDHAWAQSELVKSEVELGALQARAVAEKKLLLGYQSEAGQLGDRAIEQDELLSNLKAAEEEYLLYLGKREEARIGDALDHERILNVAIAEHPAVPALPARSVLSFGILTLFFAGALSTSLAFAVDRLNPAFRTPDEVMAFLGTPVLASLPRGGT